MNSSIAAIRAEADEALNSVWFIQRLEEIERTDITLALRLHIGSGLFVQVFCGERSGALYFALVEDSQRIFGIDREHGEWHVHPYGSPTEHQILKSGLGRKPLLSFLSRVEEILLELDLL